MKEGDAAFEALREAIDAFAAERAPDLVAEAGAEALAKVRSILAEAMAQSLLDHSAASLPQPSGSGRTRRAGRDAARRPMAGTSAERPAAGTTGSPAASRTPAEPAPAEESARFEPAAGDSYASVAPPAAAPRHATTPADHEEDELGLYVFGVTAAPAAALPEVEGVDSGEALMTVDSGPLAAIVSRVPLSEFGQEPLERNLGDVAWIEQTARAHERVLGEALARMTVVPMRLCTIYLGERQVREMLDRERGNLTGALGQLDGRTEWGVKLIAEPGALERAAARRAAGTEDEEQELSPGLAYLGQKRRQARAREDADEVAGEWADMAHDRLARAAAEARLNPLQDPQISGHHGDMLLNGVYLVDDDDADRFREVVAELDAELTADGVTAELTGPWPAYNFVGASAEPAR